MQQSLKTLFVMLMMLTIVSPLHAQKAIGLIGGYNLTNMLRDPALAATSHEQRLRFAGGVMVDFSLTQNLSLQLEPMYAQKGANFDFIDSETLDARRDAVDLAYFDLPILLKFRLQDRLTAPYLVAGPSVGLLLSAKQGGRTGKEDIKDQRESIDFGIGGGVGIFLTSESVQLFVEARYNYGLANIDKTAPDGVTLRNNGLRILVGFLL